jgi:DNA-binding NarL/FixJ family response regulator
MLVGNRRGNDLLQQAAAAVQVVDPELAGRLREAFELPGPTPPPGLTTREGQVATLAAGGLTNLEISRRLAISVRTVESHLARVYHKLGVCSRRELPGHVFAA